MNIKICFHNSAINFRSLLKINAFNRSQLIFIKRFKSLIAHFLKSYIILLEMKIMTLENLSITDKI